MADAAIDLKVGRSNWVLRGGPGTRVAAVPAMSMEPLADPAAATRQALDAPIDFPADPPGGDAGRQGRDRDERLASRATGRDPRGPDLDISIAADVDPTDITVVSPPNSPESFGSRICPTN